MSAKSLILLLLLYVAIGSLPSSGYLIDGSEGASKAATTLNAWDIFRNLSGSQAGQTVYGLSKLKRYFQRFGYIDPSHPANFSDFYDDPLENAVRLYQQNLHIEATGILTDETLHRIMTPRCGVADIINGANTMANHDSVAHYAFFPGRPQWPRSTRALTYAFEPQNKGMMTYEVKVVFTTAFAKWANVIPITFVETEDYDMADIKIGFYKGDAGDGLAPFDGPGAEIMRATAPPDGHLSLDDRDTWVLQGGDITQLGPPTAVDLETALLHAVGHLLGLDHSPDESAVMHPLVPKMRKLNLAADDIQGVQFLYGRNPNPNPNWFNDGSGGALLLLRWWWSLFGVATVVWFLLF